MQTTSIRLACKLSPGSSQRGAPAEANIITLKNIQKWNLPHGQLQAETTAPTKGGGVQLLEPIQPCGFKCPVGAQRSAQGWQMCHRIYSMLKAEAQGELGDPGA